MAKDTSTSRCPEVDSVSKLGSVIRTVKSISNDGFIISLDVGTVCYSLSKDEINDICRRLVSLLKRSLSDHELSLEFGKEQFDLPF